MGVGSEPRDSKGSPSGWGHFTLLERIGTGATGEVWRAWDSLLHRDVAVKFLAGDGAGVADTPLLGEARALARVQHANVATVYGIAEMDGRAGLWMELLHGPTLDAEISRRGALPWPQVARIGIQIAAALEALAHAELVHRDVKPANVILEQGGRAVLADFGLGRRSRAVRDEAPLQGTPVFMSPELLDGGQPTHRSDLYALGITLHWALTGAPPFRARTYEELRVEAVRGPSRRLEEERPETPKPMIEALERAIRADQGSPFRAALLRALLERALAEGEPGGAGAAPPTPRSASLPPRGSVAVLPFRNHGGDDADDYFSDGLAEEMITVLSKLRGIRVTARTSSFQFKGKDEDLATIARKLNVSMILEGGVTKLGERVRISVGLVDVGSGDRIWSETYDRTLDDIFAMQDEIAGSVVRSLRDMLTAPDWDVDAATAAAGRGTNPEAHRLYLQARYLGGLGTRESVYQALDRTLDALRLEPRHALAWVLLCRVYASLRGAMVIPAEEGLAKARDAILHAIELEPDLGEAHAVLGHLRFRLERDWKGAESAVRRALELSPSNAEALRIAGVLARVQGRFDVAIELDHRAVELDPLSSIGAVSLGGAYRDAGRLEEAEAWLRKGIDLAPQRLVTRSLLALVLMERGRLDEAWDQAQREEDPLVGGMSRAVVAFTTGRREESDAILRELVEKDADVAAYQIAQIHAARNETDEAFAWLDRAYQQEDPGLADTGTDRLFRSLRADPRWEPFLIRLGIVSA